MTRGCLFRASASAHERFFDVAAEEAYRYERYEEPADYRVEEDARVSAGFQQRRAEVLLRAGDNTAFRLYVSPIATDYRFHTFLEDPVYRISIATQNVAYNQPTQPGFYFGPELRGTIFRGCKIPKK